MIDQIERWVAAHPERGIPLVVALVVGVLGCAAMFAMVMALDNGWN